MLPQDQLPRFIQLMEHMQILIRPGTNPQNWTDAAPNLLNVNIPNERGFRPLLVQQKVLDPWLRLFRHGLSVATRTDLSSNATPDLLGSTLHGNFNIVYWIREIYLRLDIARNEFICLRIPSAFRHYNIYRHY